MIASGKSWGIRADHTWESKRTATGTNRTRVQNNLDAQAAQPRFRRVSNVHAAAATGDLRLHGRWMELLLGRAGHTCLWYLVTMYLPLQIHKGHVEMRCKPHPHAHALCISDVLLPEAHSLFPPWSIVCSELWNSESVSKRSSFRMKRSRPKGSLSTTTGTNPCRGRTVSRREGLQKFGHGSAQPINPVWPRRLSAVLFGSSFAVCVTYVFTARTHTCTLSFVHLRLELQVNGSIPG